MGGAGNGENPEQLFAMGYAGKTLNNIQSDMRVLTSKRDVCVHICHYMCFVVRRKVVSLVPFSS